MQRLQTRASASGADHQSTLSDSPTAKTHLEGLLKQQYLIFALQKDLWILTRPQPITDKLHDASTHFLPQVIDFLLRSKVACYSEDTLFDDEEANEFLEEEWESCGKGS